jgi:molybdopterin molybdotransferase
MLTVEDALALVLGKTRKLLPASSALLDALNCTLAEDITADADQPPFDKAMVDGYAVRSTDLAGADRRLRLGETILAGQVPTRPLGLREAAAIMTGAPLPPESDAVVMQERTQQTEGEVVVVDPDVRPGRNLLSKGRICRSGEVVLPAGVLLTPAGLAVLASVGRTCVSVVPRPRLAIVSTGDELVEPDQMPGPGQIRNSNAVMLEAMAMESGAFARNLPIAPDEPAELQRLLRLGLEFDLLLITGGVSVGQRDLVPMVLEQLGVRRVFHKIALKPGKPIWFGIGPERGDGPGTLVFGLPGNPVSGLVGFLLFVKPALHLLAARPGPMPQYRDASLARTFIHRGAVPTYHPARWVEPAAPQQRLGAADPLDWAGSADLLTVAQADGFAVFPAGDRVFEAGEIVRFLPLR